MRNLLGGELSWFCSSGSTRAQTESGTQGAAEAEAGSDWDRSESAEPNPEQILGVIMLELIGFFKMTHNYFHAALRSAVTFVLVEVCIVVQHNTVYTH